MNEVSGKMDFIGLISRNPDLDTEQALSNLGGLQDVYEKTVRLVIRLLPQNVDQMDKALSDNDLRSFGIKAHSIKGSMNQIGNLELGVCAGGLENASKEGNRQYCLDNYGAFRERLLLFYSQMKNIVLYDRDIGKEADNGEIQKDCLGDFTDILIRAQLAIKDYDALLAMDILSPLLQRRFGRPYDNLILSAVDALEVFDLQESLKYISDLLKD